MHKVATQTSVLPPPCDSAVHSFPHTYMHLYVNTFFKKYKWDQYVLLQTLAFFHLTVYFIMLFELWHNLFNQWFCHGYLVSKFL